MRKLLLIFLLLLICVNTASAQEACLAVRQLALTTTASECGGLDPYHVCYGSDRLKLESRLDEVTFESAGDTAPISVINSLTVNPADADPESYGIAVMTPRANLIDSSLTLIVFGDVTVKNESSAGASFVAVDVTAKRQGAFIRVLPETSSDLIQPLNWGESVKAVGRLAGGNWLHVILSNGDGWVEMAQVESDIDFEILQAYEAPTEIGLSPYGAMQTFTLEKHEPSTCGAGEGGVIIQTPELETEGLVIVNGMPMVFNGTVFLERQDKRLYVSALEGQVTLDTIFTVKTGEMTYARLDDEGRYLDIPKVLEPYFFVRARNSPYVLLPRFIDLPFSVGGLVEAFTPGTGFLTGMKLEDPCTVAWTETVNVRSGPGTNYPRLDSIDPNFAARPNARAVGADNQVWWRLAEGVWMLAGTTVFGGNCATLPVVEAPPLP